MATFGYMEKYMGLTPKVTTKAKKTAQPKKEMVTQPELKLTSDYSQIVSNLLGDAPKYSGGGVSSVDLTPMISSYQQGAESQKNVIRHETQSKRQSLLESIKRLQEDTIAGKKDLQRTYQGGRSSLEETNFLNNRAVRASKAAKGLGGSGLEDIALLDSSMKTGRKVSELANKNIDSQGVLTKNLVRGEQDANNEVQKAITEEALKLSGIDADTAQKIASLQYNEKQRVAAANAAASANRDSLLSNYNANKKSLENSIRDAQITATNVLNKYLNMSKKEQKNPTNKTAAVNSLLDLQNTYGNILPESDVKLISTKINDAYLKAGGKKTK